MQELIEDGNGDSLFRELAALTACKGDGVPGVFDFITSYRLPSLSTSSRARVLVMEALGPTLSTLPRLPARSVAVVGMQMIDVLQRIHAAGVIHRDVKPSNMVLRGNVKQETHVVLIDFGLTRLPFEEKSGFPRQVPGFWFVCCECCKSQVNSLSAIQSNHLCSTE